MLTEGDRLEIIGEGFINRKFSRPRLVIPVKDANGVARYLPLNQRSLRALARAFGPNTKEWIGKRARVVALRFHPQYGTESVILEPVQEELKVDKSPPTDLALEVSKVRWQKGRYGGELAPSAELPTLSEALQREGSIMIGGHRYRLSRNRRWVIRSRLEGE